MKPVNYVRRTTIKLTQKPADQAHLLTPIKDLPPSIRDKLIQKNG